MIRIDDVLRERSALQAHSVLQIHDEVILGSAVHEHCIRMGD